MTPPQCHFRGQFPSHWLRGQLLLGTVLVLAFSWVPRLEGQEPARTKGADEVDEALETAVAFTEESVRRGGLLYQRYCTECHGRDGKAQIDVIADATDLTQPKLWYNGTRPAEIFKSIRDGAGVAMPPYKDHFRSEEEIWHVVNYIRSLWPESMRPELASDGTDEEPAGEQRAQPNPEEEP